MEVTEIPLFAGTKEGVRQRLIDYEFYDEEEGQHVYFCRGCCSEIRTAYYGLISLLVCKCLREA